MMTFTMITSQKTLGHDLGDPTAFGCFRIKDLAEPMATEYDEYEETRNVTHTTGYVLSHR